MILLLEKFLTTADSLTPFLRPTLDIRAPWRSKSAPRAS